MVTGKLFLLMLMGISCSATMSCSGCTCTQRQDFTWTVDCSNDGNCATERIPKLPDLEMSYNVTVLNMSACIYLVPKEDDFVDYANLLVLDLSNTSLVKNNITFKGLRQLTHLNVSQNDQFPLTNETEIDPFLDLVSLQELRSYGTTGTYYSQVGYPETLLANLSSVKEIWIDARNISFGSAFEHFENLEILHISGDMIQPPWRSLEFCEMNLTRREDVKHLIHVKQLYIRKCGITGAEPRAFADLTKLEIIDLSQNDRLGVAQALLSLTGLSTTVKEVVLDEMVNAEDTRCNVQLDAGMTSMLYTLRLKRISLQHNAINRLSLGAFSNLPETLEYLDLRKNEFELAFYLFYVHLAKNVKWIDMSYNFFSNDYALYRRGSGTSQEIRMKADLSNSLNAFNGDCNEVEYCKVSDNAYQYKEVISDKCPKTSYSIPPGVVTAYLPPKLEFLDFSFSKLAFPIYPFVFEKNNTLREVRASASLLYCWEGPLYGLHHLEIIDLSYNDCTHVSIKFFSQFPNLKVVNLCRNLLELSVMRSMRGELFEHNRDLRYLNMSFNHIQIIPAKFLIHQPKLEILDLSQNGLQDFELQIDHMLNLTVVDLSYNHIYSLSTQIQQQFSLVAERHTGNLTLDLRRNPIVCSCDNLGFLRWVHNNMNHANSLFVRINQCFETRPLIQHRIRNVNDLEELILDFEKRCYSYTTLIVVVSIALAIFLNIVVGIIVHRFRWKIRYWYYVVNPPKNRKARQGYELINEDQFKFDIYIISIQDDKPFVIENLHPRLKEKYRLFIQDIDIVPGWGLYRVISNTVHASKIALFIISEHSLEDDDWKAANHLVREETLNRDQRMTLGLFLNTGQRVEWPNDAQIIRRENFIDFPDTDDPNRENAFWLELDDKINKLMNTERERRNNIN